MINYADYHLTKIIYEIKCLEPDCITLAYCKGNKDSGLLCT